MDVRLPDGRIIKNVPDGTTRSQLMARLDGQSTKDGGSSMIGSAIAGAGQGASFGYGDEIGSVLGALPATAVSQIRGLFDSDYDPKNLGESYDSILQTTREQNEQARADNPLSYLAGEVTGAVATGIGGAATKGGAALARGIGSGSTGARIVKGGVTGATSAATYGFGSAEGGLGKRVDAAKSAAPWGAAGGIAVPAAGYAVNKAVGGGKTAIAGSRAKGIEELDASLDALRTQKNAAYKTAKNAGAEIKPEAVQSIAKQVEKTIRSEIGDLDPDLHGQALAALNRLHSSAQKGGVGLQELENTRVILGQIEGGFNSPTNAHAAGVIKDAFDEGLDALSDKSFKVSGKESVLALRAAREQNKVYRKSEAIIDVLQKADGDPNKIKSGLQRLATNKKKMRGFSKVEKASILDAARNTTGEKLLKMGGKFGIDFGSSITPGNTLLPAIGAYFGSPALLATGTAARVGQKALARGKGEQLLRTIQTGGANANDEIPRLLRGGSKSAIGGGTGGASLLDDVVSPPVIEKPFSGTKIDITPEPNQPTFDLNKAQEEDEPKRNTYLAAYMQKTMQAESSGKVNAKNPNSSASGLFQFTNGTWKNMVKQYGEQSGITLKDKNDPAAQHYMMQRLTEENHSGLSGALGREPTHGELYIAHFMGINGAKKILAHRGSRERAAKLFPKEAKVNRSIFFDDGRARSVQEVISILERKVS